MFWCSTKILTSKFQFLAIHSTYKFSATLYIARCISFRAFSYFSALHHWLEFAVFHLAMLQILFLLPPRMLIFFRSWPSVCWDPSMQKDCSKQTWSDKLASLKGTVKAEQNCMQHEWIFSYISPPTLQTKT